MAYPSTLDSLTNPTPTDTLNSPSHSQQHISVNNAVEFLEAKVGVDSSAVTTSHDYKLSGVTGSDKAASVAGVETLTNKTLSNPKLNENVALSATSTELNVLDNVTAGTASASKGLVLGSTKNIDILVIDKGIKFNAPQGFLVNGKIERTVSSNNLTVAIKTLAGGDPSAADPVYVRFAGSVRTITAALSVTANAGTNWCAAGSAETATLEVDYFTYLGWKAATSEVFIGFSRIPYGKTFNDFTGTTGQYSLIANVTPAVTDELFVVGRFNATLSATASFNWSVPATSVIIDYPIYETRMLSFTPTLVGWSSAPTSTYYAYRVMGTIADVIYRQGVANTSNSTTTTMTSPFAAMTATNYVETYLAISDDNGSAVSGRGVVSSGSATISFNPTLTGGNWTGSGNKRIQSFRVRIPLTPTT